MNAIVEPIFLTQTTQAEVRMIGNAGSMRSADPLKSRWGFHVCSHDTYLKLKAIKKSYFEALKQSADYRRWKNKTVNQPAACPTVNPVFATGKGRYDKKMYPDGKGGSVLGLRWNPIPVDPGPYLNLFEQARKPHAYRVEPFDSLILGAIDEKYEKLKVLGYV